METSAKTVSLAFNKAFILSLHEPSSEISEDYRLSYSFDNQDDIEDNIQKGMPPLLLIESYNVFWLGRKLYEEIKLFDDLYPDSKFILIYDHKEIDHKFYKKVLNYFCGNIYSEDFSSNTTIKYNDIVLPLHTKIPKRTNFLIFNKNMDDKEKIINFLFDPIIS